MQYDRENPDSPELDAGEIEERAEVQAEFKTTRRSPQAPPVLQNSDGERVVGSAAFSESRVAAMMNLSPQSLGGYRKAGLVNPKLLLTVPEGLQPPSSAVKRAPRPIVWYDGALVRAILNSTTTEPFYVGGAGTPEGGES